MPQPKAKKGAKAPLKPAGNTSAKTATPVKGKATAKPLIKKKK